jgi:transcriptional regulator with XRE-family HTH domain
MKGLEMERTFGQVLREIRRSKGVSQRQLAKKVGVDFSYISKIENDRLPPPAADTIVKICDALEIPVEELLALKGKMPSEFEDAIGSSPAALKFVKQAQTMDLTDEEWEKLTHQLRRLRS